MVIVSSWSFGRALLAMKTSTTDVNRHWHIQSLYIKCTSMLCVICLQDDKLKCERMYVEAMNDYLAATARVRELRSENSTLRDTVAQQEVIIDQKQEEVKAGEVSKLLAA
jgi:hypothetical protein